MDCCVLELLTPSLVHCKYKTYKTYKTAQTAYPAFWTGLCMGTRQLIRLIDMNKVHWVMGSGLSKVIARSSVQINCRGETVCIASSSPLL